MSILSFFNNRKNKKPISSTKKEDNNLDILSCTIDKDVDVTNNLTEDLVSGSPESNEANTTTDLQTNTDTSISETESVLEAKDSLDINENLDICTKDENLEIKPFATVTIPDETLLKMINYHLTGSADTTSIDDTALASFDGFLDCSYENIQVVLGGLSDPDKISDLTGLEKATSLKALNLTGNSITSLAPITEANALTSLEALYISSNDVNLSADQINSLTGLEILRADNINTANVNLGPITLTNLKCLSLSNSKIISISSLPASLQTLNLANNNFSNIEPLNTLDNLEKLCLENTQITMINNAITSNNLKFLNLSDNDITDIETLPVLADNCDLILQRCNLKYLPTMTKDINVLDLYDNNLSSIDSLADIFVTKIILDKNNLADISLLQSLNNDNYSATKEEVIAELVPASSADDSVYHINVKSLLLDKDGSTPDILNITNDGSYDADTNIITWNAVSDFEYPVFDFSNSAGSFSGTVTGSKAAKFIDPNLTTALNNILDPTKPSDSNILQIELADLPTILDLSGQNITDLSGVENLTNVTKIILDDNSIADFSPLWNMESLDDSVPDDIHYSGQNITKTINSEGKLNFSIPLTDIFGSYADFTNAVLTLTSTLPEGTTITYDQATESLVLTGVTNSFTSTWDFAKIAYLNPKTADTLSLFAITNSPESSGILTLNIERKVIRGINFFI